jgi:Protein of unknown function (DUF2786)
VGARNKERRQAKAKDRRRRAQARTSAGHPGHDPTRCENCLSSSLTDDVRLLVVTATMMFSHDGPASADPNVRQLADLYKTDETVAGLVDQALTDLINEQIEAAWRAGWHPAEAIRLLRRTTSTLVARMAADSMAANLATYPLSTVDERFAAQLLAVDADPAGGAAAGYVRRWEQRAGVDTATAIGAAVELIGTVASLPQLPRLCPPPGTAKQTGRRQSAAEVDAKLLERVRALLTKAESTEYGAEADSFTTKAQELMVRHSIDHALLTADSPKVELPEGVRIGVDNPYEAEKVMLLDRVARANRCTAVWSRHLGFVTVVGYVASLRAVDVLYTSLLVQTTQAMLAQGSRRTARGGTRTRAFRQSFLTAFATRIGERLDGVSESGVREGAAADARLLPVLAGRDRNVQQLAEQLFPEVTRNTRTLAGYDREGWTLGTHTADLAALTAIPRITGDDDVVRTTATQAPLFSIPHLV